MNNNDVQKLSDLLVSYKIAKTMLNDRNITKLKHGVRKYERWRTRQHGTLIQLCYYKNNLLHGKCQRWHSNGKLWELHFYKNGQKHGEGKIWQLNGGGYEHFLYEHGVRFCL